MKDFGLTENCYVHCVVTAAPPRLRLPSLTPEQAAEEVGVDGVCSRCIPPLVYAKLDNIVQPPAAFCRWARSGAQAAHTRFGADQPRLPWDAVGKLSPTPELSAHSNVF